MLRLPVAPSSNLYWRDRVTVSRRNGRHVVQRYKTKEARDYQAAVQKAALAAGFRPIKKPRAIVIRVAWYREARRGDLDNRLKVVLDALQGAMYDNDSQIVAIYAQRREDPNDPRIEVSVEKAP